MADLKVGTLNVRGLKNGDKRRAVFGSLRDTKLDLVFLQECHIDSEDTRRRFGEDWQWGPSVWSAGTGRGDGVGLIFRSHDFAVTAVLSVVPGRVICTDGTWRGLRFRAVGVYAPSRIGERRGFFGALAPLGAPALQGGGEPGGGERVLLRASGAGGGGSDRAAPCPPSSTFCIWSP
uniref:Endonuclease/exonuclease/phosphatase domain-containing protein n=1 Tax=Astyanax mexicanus TaxID=7994 RepID=A0A3B1K8S2_ASTMX